MQIILLEKVVNLGNLGEVVKVKDGYARNFLIPSGQARRATDAAIKEFEAKRAELEKAAQEKLVAAQTQGEKLNGTTVKLTQKAGVDGRLFGSVTNFDISEELVKAGYQVSKAQIRMPKGPIKTVGDSSVSVALHTDVLVDINVSVYGETTPNPASLKFVVNKALTKTAAEFKNIDEAKPSPLAQELFKFLLITSSMDRMNPQSESQKSKIQLIAMVKVKLMQKDSSCRSMGRIPLLSGQLGYMVPMAKILREQ